MPTNPPVVGTLSIHPLAQLFPPLAPDDYASLKASIARGYWPDQPVVVLDGQILDGAHRARACEELGLPVPTREWTEADGDPSAFVWERNRARRHLKEDQWAVIALNWLPQRPRGRPKKGLDPATLRRGRATTLAAAMLGVRQLLTRVKLALQHVEDFVGGTTRALDITAELLDRYAEQRLAEGAARSTVNQELAAVRRGFRLAVRKGLLATRPEIVLPKCRNVREGFFSDGDFAALLVELPAYLRPVIRFARATGWRTRSEVLTLTWDQVEWDDQAGRTPASAWRRPTPRAATRARSRLRTPTK